MKNTTFESVVFCLGCIIVTIGVGMIYTPAGFIVSGSILACLSACAIARKP